MDDTLFPHLIQSNFSRGVTELRLDLASLMTVTERRPHDLHATYILVAVDKSFNVMLLKLHCGARMQ